MSASRELVAVIEGVRKIDGEATLLGHTYIVGVLHHAWFIQVDERSGRQCAVNIPAIGSAISISSLSTVDPSRRSPSMASRVTTSSPSCRR